MNIFVRIVGISIFLGCAVALFINAWMEVNLWSMLFSMISVLLAALLASDKEI